MQEQDRLQLIIENGINYGRTSNTPWESYEQLTLPNSLKDTILNHIELEQNFQIDVVNLHKIIEALQQRIEALLKHEDFDGVKKEKRKKYKTQFESYPFIYANKTYYLYPKGSDYPIDKEISSNAGFKVILEEHVKANEPLKYNYTGG
ncbi:MAG: hypothetical protein AAF489_09565 [Bacteroidota bacterium]